MDKISKYESWLWYILSSLLFHGSFRVLEFYSLYQLVEDKMCCCNSGFNTRHLFLAYTMCPLWVRWMLSLSLPLRNISWWSRHHFEFCQWSCLRGKWILKVSPLVVKWVHSKIATPYFISKLTEQNSLGLVSHHHKPGQKV